MRIDILNKKDEVLRMIEDNRPKSEISRYLDCKQSTLDRYLKIWGIEYRGNMGRRGIPHIEQRKKISLYLNNESFITSHKLKNLLIREGIKKHECESCNLDKWMGDVIPIELHHIDGNRFNNNLDNLQILCPNCHSKTDNNSGGGTKRIKR